MRRLPDRGAAPTALTVVAPGALARLVQSISDGASKLSFGGHVYGSEAVRSALNARQGDKCAFCESVILPVSTPHVEHFRPKAGYVDESTHALVKPGYYWLAYAWSNLMLACPLCNSSNNKGNRFPLASEATRATNPADNLDLESPLLIDPFEEDPRDFIRFRGPVAYAVDDNLRGATTIAVLGLNREDLVDAREAFLNAFFSIRDAVAILPDGREKEKLEGLLMEVRSDRGAYKSCLEDALTVNP